MPHRAIARMLLLPLLLPPALTGVAASTYVDALQSACINTVAGGGVSTQTAGVPGHAALDASGSLLVTTPSAVYRLEAYGSRLAPLAGSGGSNTGYVNDLGDAALFNALQGVALTRRGIVVADQQNNALRLVRANNSVETLAGRGPNNAPGLASLNAPWGVAANPAADAVYFTEFGGGVVRSCDANGTVKILAGTPGRFGTTGDGGPGVDALLWGPKAIALDPRGAGSLVFTDTYNGVIRRLDLGTGVISHVVGTYRVVSAYAPDGTPAAEASISGYNFGVAVRPSDGAVVFTDSIWRAVRAVIGGRIATIAGTGMPGADGDGGPATLATLRYPNGLVFSGEDLYVVDRTAQSVRVIRAATGNIELVVAAVTPLAATNYSARNAAVDTRLAAPFGVARGRGADATAMFVVDSDALVILRLSEDGYTSLVAGSGAICANASAACGDGGPATLAQLSFPTGIAVRAHGDIVWADTGSNRVRTVLRGPDRVATIAGTGTADYSPPGTLATSAMTNAPLGVTVDPATDEVIFGDQNCMIWRICGPRCATGVPGTLAIVAGVIGNCDFMPGLVNTPLNGSISIGAPSLMAVGPSGILYVPDYFWSVVYAINLTSTGDGNAGSISHFAGAMWSSSRPTFEAGAGRFADIGDGRPALDATVNGVVGVAVDAATGAVFLSDYVDELVRVVDPAGYMWTVAGTRVAARAGDRGAASSASVNGPRGLAFDAFGNVVLAESDSSSLRMIAYGSTPACPPGYACPCGLVPVPCVNPAQLCPDPGTVVPRKASGGFLSVGIPSPHSPSGIVYTTQVPCPQGSYCSGGVAIPCPVGTFGVGIQQSFEQTCEACPAGLHGIVAGATSLVTACARCPPGSAASVAGAMLCGYCAPGAAVTPASSCGGGSCNSSVAMPGCAACPGGTYSLGGPSTCVPLPAGAALLAWDAFVSLTRRQDDGTDYEAAAYSAFSRVRLNDPGTIVTIVLLAAAVIPVAVVLACRSRCDQILRWFDSYKFVHHVGEGDPPRRHSTAMGGACTLLAGAIVAGVAALLVSSYLNEAAIASQPVAAPVALSYVSIPSATAASGAAAVSNLPNTAPLESGLRVSVLANGARCGDLVDWAAANLLQGSGAGRFNLTSVFDNATGGATHTFDCPSCGLLATSFLDVHLDISCQSPLVLAWAVGADGAVSAASYLAPAATVAPADALSFSLGAVLQIVTKQSPSGTQRVRGFQVLPSADITPSNAHPGTLLLRVGLALAPYFDDMRVFPAQTPSQLFSSLIGMLSLFAVVGRVKYCWEYVNRRRVGYWEYVKRRRAGARRGANPSDSAGKVPAVQGPAAESASPCADVGGGGAAPVAVEAVVLGGDRISMAGGQAILQV